MRAFPTRACAPLSAGQTTPDNDAANGDDGEYPLVHVFAKESDTRGGICKQISPQSSQRGLTATTCNSPEQYRVGVRCSVPPQLRVPLGCESQRHKPSCSCPGGSAIARFPPVHDSILVVTVFLHSGLDHGDAISDSLVRLNGIVVARIDYHRSQSRRFLLG